MMVKSTLIIFFKWHCLLSQYEITSITGDKNYYYFGTAKDGVLKIGKSHFKMEEKIVR